MFKTRPDPELVANARRMCLNPKFGQKIGTVTDQTIGTDPVTDSFWYVVDGVVWCLGAQSGAVNCGNYGEFMDTVRAGKIPRFKPE